MKNWFITVSVLALFCFPVLADDECPQPPELSKSKWNFYLNLKLPEYKNVPIASLEMELEKDVVQLIRLSSESINMTYVSYYVCQTAKALSLDSRSTVDLMEKMVFFFLKQMQIRYDQRLNNQVNLNEEIKRVKNEAHLAFDELDKATEDISY